MTMRTVFAAALVLTACTNGTGPTSAGSRPVAESFVELRKKFVAAYARADADAVAAFYSPDATYVGTAGDVVTGREQLLIGLRREVPAFRGFEVDVAESGYGDGVAWERGTYRATLSIPGRPAEPISGPYLVVYEHSSGHGWQIKQHMATRAR
jgi:uncharacterized protein (TIGR02246 family)